MEKDKLTINKTSLICSIIQIVISLFCLIYNIISKKDIVIWIVMLSSGICLLSANINKK